MNEVLSTECSIAGMHAVTRTNSRVIVKAISDIAHGLGKHAIAEFVDDEETIELLTRYGIEYGQGFHIGKPASADSTFFTTIMK